ncbi:MAG: methyl-accepting chemotaxis protein [Bacteroidales bacterium]|nr:methyl-accepting chemotaxis protein [Bacteroidales bacterium]
MITKKNKSILWRIIGIVLPITVLLIGSACAVVYLLINDANNTIISNTSQEIVSSNAQIISEKMMSIVKQCKSLADNSQLHSLPPEKQTVELKRLVDSDTLFSFGTILSADRKLYNTSTSRVANITADNLYFVEMIVKQRDFMVASPQRSRISRSDIVYVCVPIKDKNGKNISIMSVAVSASTFSELISNISVSGLGRGYVIDVTDTISKPDGLDIAYAIKDSNMGHVDQTGLNGENLTIFWQTIENTPWKLAVAVPTGELKARQYFIRIIFLTLVPLACLLFIATLYYLVKKLISRPLKDVLDVAEEVSHGRLFAASKLDNLNEDELGILSRQLKEMADQIDTTASLIKQESKQIAISGNEINSIAATIYKGSINQSESVDHVSATIEEMITSISQNAENVKIAKESSEAVAFDMNQVAKAGDRSLESNKKIAEKTKIVKEIASKTDILAINAAVEASRAGENGKGFAVVAAEIRKLAEKCRAASIEIDTASKENIKFTSIVSTMIDRLTPRIRQNSNMVSEIAHACDEQHAATEVITNSIIQLSQISQENSTFANALTSSSQKLAEYASHLNKSMEFFQTSTSPDYNDNEILQQIQEHANAIKQLNEILEAERRALAPAENTENPTT